MCSARLHGVLPAADPESGHRSGLLHTAWRGRSHQTTCHTQKMAARSPQRIGAEAFTTPEQANQRRYEALRAWYVDGLSYEQAGQRFGYTRWAMVDLVRQWRAGLLQLLPDLAGLDLPGLVHAAGYPGTSVIPATSWLLSLLALKLTRTRRVSHVDDLLDDPAAGLLCGMAVLPKKSALTDYSYRLGHDHQRGFPAALDQQMISAGL